VNQREQVLEAIRTLTRVRRRPEPVLPGHMLPTTNPKAVDLVEMRTVPSPG
jgi:hypothetical protein